MSEPETKPPLRRGWTTGTCAAAAARAAFEALASGQFPDPVRVLLPGGARPAFALAMQELGANFARAGIIKDAGDDPDVTHGALVIVRVSPGPPGSGLMFAAGEGVGTVTRPGLPLPVGEPAINPVPRQMIAAAIAGARALVGGPADVVVEISIPGGEKLAQRTLNGRLGIVGGLSILGTTGIVVPYSCAAWIDTIHRGIDVARAMGLTHIAAATGSTSEKAVQKLYGMADFALIEMGDFVGGLLKYLRGHPVENITIAGGFAKMTKLAQGMADLHSRRGEVDLAWLAGLAGGPVAGPIGRANSALEAFALASTAGVNLAEPVAEAAWTTAAGLLKNTAISLEIAVFDREGKLLARTGLRQIPDRALPVRPLPPKVS